MANIAFYESICRSLYRTLIDAVFYYLLLSRHCIATIKAFYARTDRRAFSNEGLCSGLFIYPFGGL